MSETSRLKLPLLMPSQAQKHVTVNEALLRLDALCQLTLLSRSVASPPEAAEAGSCYSVPEGTTTGPFAGRSGEIAISTNGGWDFVAPQPGWRAWIADEGAFALFDGGWVERGGPVPVAGEGEGALLRSIQIDHAVGAGATSETAAAIPAAASVWGVTGRVIDPIGGATSFRIGVPDSTDRYGTGIGTAAGAWLRGLTGSPLTYWSDTPLLLTAEGGSFDGTGLLRLIVYAAELPLPA